mgnify:CR=1 FL=1
MNNKRLDSTETRVTHIHLKFQRQTGYCLFGEAPLHFEFHCTTVDLTYDAFLIAESSNQFEFERSEMRSSFLRESMKSRYKL